MYNGYPAELKSINCNEMVKSLGGSAATDLKEFGGCSSAADTVADKKGLGSTSAAD